VREIESVGNYRGAKGANEDPLGVTVTDENTAHTSGEKIDMRGIKSGNTSPATHRFASVYVHTVVYA
jgi:hypothetical protein